MTFRRGPERSLERLRQAEGDLFLGGDIARTGDYTVFAVLERNGPLHRLVALLRLRDQRLPQQQTQLDPILALPKFRRACLDTTGLGLGLVEYAQEKWGRYKVQGINFASTEPISDRIRLEGRRNETARVTELMAVDLLNVFEERSINIEVILDADAREDLRKPEKITSPRRPCQHRFPKRCFRPRRSFLGARPRHPRRAKRHRSLAHPCRPPATAPKS